MTSQNIFRTEYICRVFYHCEPSGVCVAYVSELCSEDMERHLNVWPHG